MTTTINHSDGTSSQWKSFDEMMPLLPKGEGSSSFKNMPLNIAKVLRSSLDSLVFTELKNGYSFEATLIKPDETTQLVTIAISRTNSKDCSITVNQSGKSLPLVKNDTKESARVLTQIFEDAHPIYRIHASPADLWNGDTIEIDSVAL